MRRASFAASLLIVAIVGVSPLAAQTSDPLGTYEMKLHAARLHPAAETAVNPQAAEMTPNASRRRTGTILMIVGGAVLVTGLIADESAVTISGAIVGGIGLFLWLDSGGKVEVGAHRTPAPVEGFASR